jgi:sugar phosphate isomerase/epimerase
MKISLAGWSLHRRFRSQDNPLTLLDFPRVARTEFDINAIELNSPFFVSRDKRYLTELDNVAAGEGVDLLNIAIDGMGDLADPDRAARHHAVEANAAWLPVAAHLGCKAIRVAAGGVDRADDEEALLWAMDCFSELVERGAKDGVMVLIENQPGVAADPDRILRIVEMVDNPWIGTLVDFANFPTELDRYEAAEKLLSSAEAVHASMRSFNEQGLETTLDIARCLNLAQKEAHDGVFGILFDGEGDDHEGVLRAKELVEKCLRGEIKSQAPAKSIATVKSFGKKLPGLGKKTAEGLKKIGFRFEI